LLHGKEQKISHGRAKQRDPGDPLEQENWIARMKRAMTVGG
jgi:hypothetical protein